jgi:outer membrane biosynthesis protein TonB
VQQERKQGLIISGAMHFIMLLLMIFGLPAWLLPPPPPEIGAISVEVLPISELTNVKPSEQPPAPEKKAEPEKPAEKPPAPEPEKPKPPTPPVKTNEPPPPPKEELAPPLKEEKKPDVKKEEKKEEKKKEKAKEEDLDAVLKAIQKTVQKEKQKADAKEKKDEEKAKEDSSSTAKSVSSNYDDSLPMSLSEKDAIRSQFAKCWNVPAGARNAHELIVPLHIEVAMDGSVMKVELASDAKAKYSSDTFYRAAADSAIRAVHQCSPLKNLPPEKYGTWKEMELVFDPKEMLF